MKISEKLPTLEEMLEKKEVENLKKLIESNKKEWNSFLDVVKKYEDIIYSKQDIALIEELLYSLALSKTNKEFKNNVDVAKDMIEFNFSSHTIEVVQWE